MITPLVQSDAAPGVLVSVHRGAALGQLGVAVVVGHEGEDAHATVEGVARGVFFGRNFVECMVQLKV